MHARYALNQATERRKHIITLEALKLSSCYPAFKITTEVPEIYMRQFWNTIKKIGKTYAYDFKLDKKKCRVDTEVFRKILQICPRLPDQDFVELPSEEDLLTFIKELGASLGNQRDLIDSGNHELKSCGLCTIKGMLIMLLYSEKTLCIKLTIEIHQRFTKVIINHFISKDNSISMKNRINLYIARDDSLLGALNFIYIYETYLDYATGKVPPKKARKFKKSASPKLKTVPASPKEPTQKGKRVKRPAKKATTSPSTGVVIRDTPDKSLRKPKKIKRETHKLQASGSSEGADFESEVPDEQTGKTKDTSEELDKDENDDFNDEDDDGGNDDDSGSNDNGDNDAQDSEQTDSDDDENPSFTLKDYEEEEHDEEYIFTLEKDKSDDEEKMYEEEDDDVTKALYEDLNITQGLRDTDMTNADQGREDLQNDSHEFGFVQKEDDGHVTLMNVHDKTKETPNFASLFWFEQRVSTLETKLSEFNQINQFADVVSSISGIIDNYIASKMKDAVDVAVQLQTNKFRDEAQTENQEFLNQVDSIIKAIIKEQVQAQVSKIMPKIEKYVTESLGAEVLVRSTNQPQTSYAVAASLSKFELKKILIDKIEENKSINISDIQKDLYNALVESYNFEKDIISSYGDVVTLKRGRDDQDKDEDPSAGLNRGSKKKRSGKEVESSKEPTHKESKSTSSSKGASRSQPKSSGKSAQAEEHGQKWPTFNLLKGSCKSFAELEYHFEECYKAVNDLLDWYNPEGREYPFDLSKPLSLIEDRGCQVVPTDYFINNDLEYLKGGSSCSKYVTSTTRTKAAKYDNVEGIEDMVLTLWSPVKVAYNKHVVWGTYHWGPKQQRFYAYACHWKSPHDVYSKRRIIVVTSVKVMRWYDYGYLEEIVVRRDDNVLYKFKEGDFPRLNLCDIEECYILRSRRTAILMWRIGPDTYQNQRDLPRDIPLDSVVVPRYEKRSKSENKGRVPTEMELVLEQTQQGTSYEVSRQSVKVKELQDKRILKTFKLSYQEKYEHVGPKSQDHKMARLQDDDKRLCLVDDLKKFKITFYLVKDTSQSLKDAKDFQGGNKGRDKVGRQGGEEKGTLLVCYLAGSGDRATKERYSIPALFEVWEMGKNGP
ncbi:hypothetical protein Tco_0789289 [Tanacetum coccineum]